MELVWVRVRVEEECFWVNLREDNKVSESKMTVSESNMADFKMVAIIKLSQNEWVKIFLCKMAESKMAVFKMTAIIKFSENEWVWVRLNFFDSESEWSESVYEWIWEKITRYLNPRWQCLNPTWQNSRWLPSSSDWTSLSQSVVQNGWIQDGRIQDGCHQVNQIELVWVRVRMEEECFWVNLREDNKVFVSKTAVSESNMAEFKMADIIKFSQNKWVWVRLN